jgi:hypothetical protein
MQQIPSEILWLCGSPVLVSTIIPKDDAVRRAFNENGELAAVVELRGHLPLIRDDEQARAGVRTVVSWKPLPRSPMRAGCHSDG